eukprot:TRINITY_DN40135_c0_g1_i1.p1 TRINITY_DN40135_c0_g1~~TRINITY_DN40135_c0_g1_i1.p1  ORF type:complete len:427 (+),score=144.67 TRINITY_DN40135_c0_g1_i1:39-1283(+)
MSVTLSALRARLEELQQQCDELASQKRAAEEALLRGGRLDEEAEQLRRELAVLDAAFAVKCATQCTQMRIRVRAKSTGAVAENVLRVDAFGRPALLPQPIPRSPRYLQPGTVALRAWFASDAASADSFLAAARVAASTGRSYFLGASDEPLCALEMFARRVFDHHCRGRVGVDPSRSGVEWWVNVRPRPGDPLGRPIDFHWDKDMTLLKQTGVHLHPFLSTVTYLKGTGAPTLVLDRRLGGAATPGGGVCVPEGTIESGVVSWAEAGKHVTFDGRLLHGAVDLDGHCQNERITLIANVFVNHRFGSYYAEGGHPCADLLRQLGSPEDVPETVFTGGLPMESRVVQAAAAVRPLRVPLGNVATLSLPAAELLAEAAPDAASTLKLKFVGAARPEVTHQIHEDMIGEQVAVSYRMQ